MIDFRGKLMSQELESKERFHGKPILSFEVGGLTGVELEKELLVKGVRIDSPAMSYLRSKYLQDVGDKKRVRAVILQLDKDLGFPSNKSISDEDLREKANLEGLDLCDTIVGPYLRLAYTNQPAGELIRLAMWSTWLDSKSSDRYVFRLGNASHELYFPNNQLYLSSDHKIYEWGWDEKLAFRLIEADEKRRW